MRWAPPGLAALALVGGLLGGASALAAPAPGATAAAARDVYAVVVGYNGGQGKLPDLRFADDDAVRFTLLFEGLATPEQRVRVFTLTEIDAETAAALAAASLPARRDGPPTRAAFAAALDEVARALGARRAGGPPPSLFIIYAGHGLGDRVLLQPEAGPEAAITGHEIRAAVANLARVAPDLRAFVFLDACRSQSLFAKRGPDAEIGPDLAGHALSLERSAETVRIGILTAAASGKPAGEVGALASGYFSHALGSGLAGAADADGDRVVSFGELAAFVAVNTQKLTRQSPWFEPPGRDLDAPALDLRGRHNRLELSAAPPGRYVVEATSGRPIFVEVFKGAKGPLRLVLPAGRYRLVRVPSAGRPVRAEVELRAGEAVDVARVAFAPRAATAAAGIQARGDGDAAEGGAIINAAAVAAGDDADLPPGVPELAFSSPFEPAMVATLAAGYDAGRSPADAPEDRRNVLALAAGLATPPLGASGSEPGLALSYRRLHGRLFVGARFAVGRSEHAAAGGYQLERYAALVEAGPIWSLGGRLEISAAAAAGSVTVIHRGDGAPVRGDPFAPALGAAAGVGVRVGGGFMVGLQGRALAQWIRVDGARRAFVTPGADVGIAYQF